MAEIKPMQKLPEGPSGFEPLKISSLRLCRRSLTRGYVRLLCFDQEFHIAPHLFHKDSWQKAKGPKKYWAVLLFLFGLPKIV